MDLQGSPFLPLESEIFTVIIIRDDKPGDPTRNGIGGAAGATNKRSIVDFFAAIIVPGGNVQVWLLARRAGQEVKKFATHVI